MGKKKRVKVAELPKELRAKLTLSKLNAKANEAAAPISFQDPVASDQWTPSSMFQMNSHSLFQTPVYSPLPNNMDSPPYGVAAAVEPLSPLANHPQFMSDKIVPPDPTKLHESGGLWQYLPFFKKPEPQKKEWKKAKLEILCLGFGRTGTYSLKHALDKLGYPCYHSFLMKDDKRHKMDGKFWANAKQLQMMRQPINFDKVYGELGYKATADWPSISFWRELIATYPDAKVILTTRDYDSWYNSLMATIATMPKLPRWLARFGFKSPAMLHDQFAFDKEFAINYMKAHYHDVKLCCRPGQVLEFSVKDGWEPLCKFLNKPVPGEPFPKLNDAASYQKRLKHKHFMNYAINTCAILCILAFFYDLANSVESIYSWIQYLSPKGNGKSTVDEL
ncbi:hypothetical protein BC830DRAFT_1149774 [Chytriomyces sp. MP71]|nr:hypothetical protein BC830DRAFT_1149774 [Chytriomyces sp. MP71]